MKLELRENMYVRTKDGIIDKILKLNKSYVKGVSQKDELYAYDIDNIVKASYNIIDLIKSKDIILGRDGKIYQCWKTYKDYVFTYSKNKQGQTITLVDYQIDKVLTKEQMEQMAYKVGE